MKVEMTIKEEVFVTDRGERVPYFSCVAKIGDTDVRFVPKNEDKSLLKYLMSSASTATK